MKDFSSAFDDDGGADGEVVIGSDEAWKPDFSGAFPDSNAADAVEIEE